MLLYFLLGKDTINFGINKIFAVIFTFLTFFAKRPQHLTFSFEIPL